MANRQVLFYEMEFWQYAENSTKKVPRYESFTGNVEDLFHHVYGLSPLRSSEENFYLLEYKTGMDVVLRIDSVSSDHAKGTIGYARTKDGRLPDFIDQDGERRAIPIKEGYCIYEYAYFVYFFDKNTIGMENIHHGPGITALIEFMKRKCEGIDKIEKTLVLKKEAMKLLDNIKDVFSLELGIISNKFPEPEELDDGEDAALENIARLNEVVDLDRMTLKLSVSRRKKKKEGIKGGGNLARWFFRNREVASSLKIQGVTIDGDIISENLFKDKASHTIQIKTDLTIKQEREDIWRQIVEAHGEIEKYLS